MSCIIENTSRISYAIKWSKILKKRGKKTYLALLNMVFYLVIVWFGFYKGESNKLQYYLVIDLIKHLWYLIHVERQKETVTI